MKRLLSGVFLSAFVLAACQTARTQAEPQVISVPVDEMTRPPSLGPATAGTTDPAPPPRPVGDSGSTPVASPAVSDRHTYNSCTVDGPYIAITFDDGPHPEHTPKLLDELKKRGIKATFYVVGRNVAEYPEIVKRMDAEGHEVANHTWTHPQLTPANLAREMNATSAEIRKITGKNPTNMRPPYGYLHGKGTAQKNAFARKIADEYGMKVILWSVDPLDWKYRNSSRVASEIIQNTKPGAIILAHDIHGSTVAAMPNTLDTLLGRGYKFVTVSELIAMDRPAQLVKKESPRPPAADRD